MTDPQSPNRLLALMQDPTSEVKLGVGKKNSLLEFASPAGAFEEAAKPVRPKYNPKKLFEMVRDLELYGTIELWEEATGQFARMKKLDLEYDRYCPECKMQTPWKTVISNFVQAQTTGFGGMNRLENACQRRKGHSELIFLEFTDRDELIDSADTPAIIRKIGQTPSLAEFHSNDVAEFEKVTTRAQRSDYLKSVQAFTQGFAAGACTYLRRVVEGIMDQERDAAMEEMGVTEWKEYREAKNVLQRMKLLGDRLPQFLVENPMLYKVLSHGIHSLSEDECAALYPKLRAAVQLLFGDRLEKFRKVQHRERLAEELNQVKTGKK